MGVTAAPAPTDVVDPDVLALATNVERVVMMIRRLTPVHDGLSLTASSMLRTLDVSGPTRLTELASTQAVTQPAMTQLVNRFERDGLVERRASEVDGRVVLVAITPAGRELLARRRLMRAAQLASLLAERPDEERASILAAVPALDLLAGLGQGE